MWKQKDKLIHSSYLVPEGLGLQGKVVQGLVHEYFNEAIKTY